MPNRKKYFSLAVVFVLLAAGCTSPAARINRLANAADAAAATKNLPALDSLAQSINKSDFNDKRLRGYSDETLEQLFAASVNMTCYLPDNPDYAMRAELVFNEKVRRGKFDDDNVYRMFSIFMDSRLFDKAASIKERFPKVELPEVPAVKTPESIPPGTLWQAYEMEDDGKSIVLKTLSLGKGPKIVTVIMPGCPAAKQAVLDIMADTQLAATYGNSNIFLVRRFEAEDINYAKQWATSSPIYIAHKSSDFPGVWMLNSPMFYFLLDGKIKYELKGWTRQEQEESLKEIRAGMQSIGLLNVPQIPAAPKK